MGWPNSGKMERLVAAAIACFHEDGYARTSIAQIAERAGVPSGNVFYYFRTKDDLARAAVEEWRRLLASYLEPLEAVPGPWTRLSAFLDQGAMLVDMYVASGCPLASLTRDLRQAGPALAREAPRIYAVQSDWIARQFSQAGLGKKDSRICARMLMARYHGAIHLAYSQGDARLLIDEIKSMKGWLRELRKA